MELVETVREIQKKNGYTDREMADIIGYSRTRYNQICKGNVPVSPLFRLKVNQVLPLLVKRVSAVDRETKETKISLELNIDGIGQYEINTGIKMFDHLLVSISIALLDFV